MRLFRLLMLIGFLHTVPAYGLEAVTGGGFIESDGLWFQAGGLFLTGNSPGVIYGMKCLPGGEREFAYLVVFQHKASDTSHLTTGGTVSDKGQRVIMTDGIEIDGKAISLRMSIEVDRTKMVLKSEELSFDGQSMDLSKGRLFLVDLRGDSPKWEQVPATLPGKLPIPKEVKDARDLAKRVLDELPRKSKEAKAFLK